MLVGAGRAHLCCHTRDLLWRTDVGPCRQWQPDWGWGRGGEGLSAAAAVPIYSVRRNSGTVSTAM